MFNGTAWAPGAGKTALVVSDIGATITNNAATTTLLAGGPQTTPTAAVAGEILVCYVGGLITNATGGTRTVTFTFSVATSTVFQLTTPSIASNANARIFSLLIVYRHQQLGAANGQGSGYAVLDITGASAGNGPGQPDVIAAALCQRFTSSLAVNLHNNAPYAIDLLATLSGAASPSFTIDVKQTTAGGAGVSVLRCQP